MSRVGQVVKVRGEEYRIVHIRGCSHLGTKFFGKFRFFLKPVQGEGEAVTCYGKQVAGNTKLHPVTPFEKEEFNL